MEINKKLSEIDDWQEVVPNDWQEIEPSLYQQGAGYLGTALENISNLGKLIDAYSGDASTRAAIYAAQKGQNPLSAAISQYGKTEGAPTGAMIAKEAGVPDVEFPESIKQLGRMVGAVSPIYQLLPESLKESIGRMTLADLAGFGIDIAAGPTSLIGGPQKSAITKVSKITKPITSKVTKPVIKAAGNAAAWLGEAATGIPKQDIKTYAKKGPELMREYVQAGGDISGLADDIRSQFQNAIQAFKTKNNEAIALAEANASKNKTLPLGYVERELLKFRATLHPTLEAEGIKEINDLLKSLRQVATSKNAISPYDIVAATRVLQEEAKPAYNIKGMFAKKDTTSQAAKKAAVKARELRNLFVPGAKEPYENLEKLRKIDKNLNPNLITPGTPDAALMAAGSGANKRNQKKLEKLGKLIGLDMKNRSADLSAMRIFADAPFFAVDQTGKSGTRLIGAAGTGAFLGHLFGVDPKIGAAIMAALTSPKALKAAIDMGRIPKSLVESIVGSYNKLSPEQLNTVFSTLKSLEASGSLNNSLPKDAINTRLKALGE